jgi:RNA polymerase sigma-70 factor (ECF subfamily)
LDTTNERAPSAVTFDRFYREHFARIARSVQPIVGHAAEDVAQEAFVALLPRYEEIATFERPEAWVCLVARRIAMRYQQRDSNRRLKEALGAELGRRVGLEIAAPAEEPPDLDLRQAMNGLPSPLRAAVWLHYMGGLPVREVARAIGCTETTAKVRLHRARERLGQHVGGHRGRWLSERSWQTDDVVAELRASGNERFTEVVVEEVPGRGTRRELVLEGGAYRLWTDDGERLDDGRFAFRGNLIELRPTGVSGSVLIQYDVDGDLITFRQRRNTTPPTREVPDVVYLRLLLESGPFVWTGRSRDNRRSTL